jgi:L-fuconolactonase
METSRTQAIPIDAHHHLWRYQAQGYAWMTEAMKSLRRSFTLTDLYEVASASGIAGTVLVEVERTAEETRNLTSIAATDDLIQGVVGWVDLTAPSIHSDLENMAQLPKLRGLRHPIHDEPDPNYILRADFNRGIAALHSFGLTYDLLIFENHLPQTISFVDRHPNQTFILDHIAKPRIREGSFYPWRENIQELALRPNVYCKLSGMVTEASWTEWDRPMLRPYIDTVIEAFSPWRVMFGSDWPLVTLASTYEEWLNTVRSAITGLSSSEQQWILGWSATEAYGLSKTVTAQSQK